jgi:hypothetical protein
MAPKLSIVGTLCLLVVVALVAVFQSTLILLPLQLPQLLNKPPMNAPTRPRQLVKIPNRIPINPHLRIRIPVPQVLKAVLSAIGDIVVFVSRRSHLLEVVEPRAGPDGCDRAVHFAVLEPMA